MKYIVPEIEVIKFKICDVITGSMESIEEGTGDGNIVKPPSGTWGE